MATLPFPAQASTPPPTPQPPKGTGLRRVIIAVAASVVCLGLAAIVLFGTRTAHRMRHRAVTPPAEAAPRPANTGDPLKGLQADYASLLTKPAPAPQPAAALTTQLPAQTVPVTTQPATPKPNAQKSQPQKDPGMLVLEGKRHAAKQQPGVPQLSPAAMIQETVQAGEQEKEPRPPTAQEAFMQKASGLQPVVLQDRLHDPESPFMVLGGSVIPATLITGINSDLPGPISAQVRANVYDTVSGKHLLIPQGSRLIGAYDSAVVYGQNRALMAWQRLLLPDGSSLQLEGAPGMDVAGYSGLRDKVNTHFWKLLGAVLMSSALSVGAQAPFGNTQGFVPTLPQQFAEEFSQGVNRAGQAIVNRQLQQKPTIEIRPGMSLLVFVHRDIVLKPWKIGVASEK